MPFSTSIVLPTGFPSSSTLIAPRAAASVPSSTMFTNLFATGLPIRSEKIEIPFRLKSASMPWPIASWRRIPDAPAPEDDRHLAGGGLDRVEEDDGARDGLLDDPLEALGRVEADVGAAGDVVAVRLLLPVLLGDAGEAEARHRLEVLDDAAVRVGDQDRARLVAEADVDLLDPLVGGEDLLVEAGEERQLLLRPHVLPAGLHGVAGREARRRASAPSARASPGRRRSRRRSSRPERAPRG